ncbi:MAG: hypothetical protein ABIJ47_01380 [Candidatus Bathyarchaeota archaeon]
MTEMNKRETSFTLMLAGAAILAHQVLIWGRIDLVDVLHHEWVAGVLLAAGLGIRYGGDAS